jgi:hypothetical protein
MECTKLEPAGNRAEHNAAKALEETRLPTFGMQNTLYILPSSKSNLCVYFPFQSATQPAEMTDAMQF